MTPVARVHFLNVGRDDCIIMQHLATGHVSMIDINCSDDLSDSELDGIRGDIAEAAKTNSTCAGIMRSALLQEAVGLSRHAAFRKAAAPFWEEIKRKWNIALQDPITYLQGLGVRDIFRLIITHPDADHFTGLHRLKDEMDNTRLTISNFWHIGDKKVIADFKSDDEEQSWKVYKAWQQAPFSRTYRRGDKIKYFNQDDANGIGDGMFILSPSDALVNDAHTRFESKSDIYNNASFVLMLICGKAKLIFGGDAFGNSGSSSPADDPQEGNMPNAWKDILNSTLDGYKASQVLPNTSLLKASHHGLESGFHDKAVPMMNPKITIISEGAKTETDAQHRYPNETLSTRFYGNIVADVYDTGQIDLWTSISRPEQGSTTQKNAQGYFFNNKSIRGQGLSFEEFWGRQA